MTVQSKMNNHYRISNLMHSDHNNPLSNMGPASNSVEIQPQIYFFDSLTINTTMFH